VAEVAWVNGRIHRTDEPAIAPTDRGFLHGEGLFETMRAYQGVVFLLDRHLLRMRAAAAELGLTPPGEPALRAAVAEALAASEMREAAVRVTLTPGTPGSAAPTLVVLVRDLHLPPTERYQGGCRAVTVSAAMARGSRLRWVKSLNYLDKLVAQRAAEQAGAHEAILVDADGCLIEAAMRNLFAVVEGVLVTPAADRGLLPGITRGAVLELAGRLGLPHEERDLPRVEALTASECFLTSSIAEILPVASLDEARYRAPGPVAQRVTEAYRALVAEETGAR
jgi:branched-subunit amino acid aminotransferase/4-amino-4-deoxychorismate lyase